MGRTIDEIVLEALEQLRAMANRMASSPEEAEDLVQETCIRALRKGPTLVAHPCPEAYLFRILRNLWHDRHRRRLAAPQIVSMEGLRAADGELPLAGHSTRDVPAVVRESLDEDVQDALDALPEAFRTALWLREIEGLSYEEIATRLGIPPGTVRSRLSRARERLLTALSHRGQHGRAPRDTSRGKPAS